MTLAELLARQTAELRSLSAEELKSLEPLFEEARESLRQSLEALIARGAEEQFTAAQLKATMAQVESAISVIGKGLRGSLAAATDAAEDAAVRHLQQQAELALQAFGKPVAVDLQTARRFARKNTTLLERHAKFSAGWEQRSIAKVKKTLAVETLRNTPRQDVIRKLTEPGSPLEGSRHDAERLLYTETFHAYNSSTFEQMEKAETRGDVKMKRLINPVDNRTARDTLAIIAIPGNLVRPVHELFEDPVNGKGFLYPPNRPYDRARIVFFFDTPEERSAVERERAKAQKFLEQQEQEIAAAKARREARDASRPGKRSAVKSESKVN